MNNDTHMHDAGFPRYPEPSETTTPSPYPSMYHGESPLVETQSPSPTSRLDGAPTSQPNGHSPPMDDQPWTSDFFKRLSAISKGRGDSLRAAVNGDGIRSQDTNDQPAIVGDGIYIENTNERQFNSLPGSAGNGMYCQETDDGSAALSEIGDHQHDLERSRGRGRGRGRGRPRGSRGSPRGTTSDRGRRGGRSRGWKTLLQGTEHADLFAKPKPKRTPTGKKRGRKPAHLQPSVNASGEQWMDPGPEFRVLQGNATRAFLDGDLDTALDNAKLALEKNPEVFVAHKMIHDIYQKQGKERDAIYALAVGVNLRKSADIYAELGERIMALGTREYEWARECFLEAIKIDADNYRARAGKLELHLALEEWTPARVDARILVRMFPAELELVNKYASLCMQSGNFYEWESAQVAYEAALEVYEKEDMLGDDYEQQWTHVNDYSEILLKRGLHQQGIYQLKKLARWILGRRNDEFWDRIPDDREFDTSDDRRVQLWEYRQDSVSKDPAQYGDGLPLELRIKLGLLRLRMFMRDEAFRHFEFLQRQNADIEGLEDLFREVAEYLKNEAMFREALTFFERLLPMQGDSNIRFWLSLAQCYLPLGRNEDAEMCYLKVMKADEYDLESRTQLARLYTSTGQEEKALKLVHEVMKIGARPIPLPPAKPLPPLQPRPSTADKSTEKATPDSTAAVESMPTLTPTSVPIELPPVPRRRLEAARGANGRFESWTPDKQKEGGAPLRHAEKFDTVKTRVHRHYAAAQELWPSSRAGGDESSISKWMEHADAMAVEFKRAQTMTFSDSRHKEPARPSLLPQAVIHEMEYIKKEALRKLNVPTDNALPGQANPQSKIFSISAGEWHCLLSDLTLLHAERVNQEKCYDLLQSCLLKPAMFRQDPELSNTSQAISLYCALRFNDGKLMTEVAHHYILRGQRQSPMSFQLLGATGRLSHGQAYFYDRKATKWLHETIPAKVDIVPDPGLLTLHGHNSGGSTHANGRPALPFLLRALALQPENIVVNLSIATTYLSNALQKNATDRQQAISQGLAFFHRYYDLRVADGKAVHLQEAEFNRARMWQQLGFVHRAVEGYEKVLAMSEDVQKEVACDGEDFTMEAAYALQRILVEAGNEDAAREIGEKWLVL